MLNKVHILYEHAHNCDGYIVNIVNAGENILLKYGRLLDTASQSFSAAKIKFKSLRLPSVKSVRPTMLAEAEGQLLPAGV